MDEELGKKMQSLAQEISSREKEGFVAMEVDKEDVPADEKEVEPKDRPSKRSDDYANLNIDKLIQSAEDGEGEGSPDHDSRCQDQLSSVPAELSESESSSDSDSDSDVVVLRPDTQREQSPYPEEVSGWVWTCGCYTSIE